MAYPEPTPAIKAKKSGEFLQRLESFELSAAQKEIYKKAMKRKKGDADKTFP